MKRNENGFDPQLRAAIEEIKPILKKYDCLASMLLVSKTHSEFLHQIESSWSVMKFEGPHLRFRSKREDFPSKELHDENTKASVHALTSFVEWTRISNASFQNVIEQLRKHMSILWETWEN